MGNIVIYRLTIMHVITPLDVWIVAIVAYAAGASAGYFIAYVRYQYHPDYSRKQKTNFQSLNILQIGPPSDKD